MTNMEKVLHGLSSCGNDYGIPNICEVTECPYRGTGAFCSNNLAHDANMLISELLKAQEPRVMTWDEVRAAMKAPVWKETKSMHDALYQGWVLAYDIQTGQGITGTRLGMAEPSGRVVWYKVEDYGKTWRCWTSRPTDEQREATPWENTPAIGRE